MKYCYYIFPNADLDAKEIFNEIVNPVTKFCGYKPFDIDRISSKYFAVDTADKLISASDVCIADISTDSPNVWYEIGYAYASAKRVILLCSEKRNSPYPFSVNHRYILLYSIRTLSEAGIMKINLQHRLLDSDITDTIQPLTILDIEVLNFINSLQNTPHEAVSKERITASRADFQVALKRLVDKKCIEYIYSVDESEHQSSYYRVTAKGINVLNRNGESKDSINEQVGSVLSFNQDGANGLQIGQVSGGVVNVMLPVDHE